MLCYFQGYSKVIQLYVHVLFCVLFHYRLLQGNEYSSMCYTVGPCCLPVLYIAVCSCWSQTPNLCLLPLPFPFGKHKFVFCVSLFLFCK